MRVNKHTRAGKNGKVIVCPCGDNSTRVYHFSWSKLMCPCGNMVNKEDYDIKKELQSRNL
jgi:hypothetical protein